MWMCRIVQEDSNNLACHVPTIAAQLSARNVTRSEHISWVIWSLIENRNTSKANFLYYTRKKKIQRIFLNSIFIGMFGFIFLRIWIIQVLVASWHFQMSQNNWKYFTSLSLFHSDFIISLKILPWYNWYFYKQTI